MTQARIVPWPVEAVRDEGLNRWALSPGRAGRLNAMVFEPKDSESSALALVEQVLVRERPLLFAPVAIGTAIVMAFTSRTKDAVAPIYWLQTDPACLVVTAESRIEIVTSSEVKRVCALFEAHVLEEASEVP